MLQIVGKRVLKTRRLYVLENEAARLFWYQYTTPYGMISNVSYITDYAN